MTKVIDKMVIDGVVKLFVKVKLRFSDSIWKLLIV